MIYSLLTQKVRAYEQASFRYSQNVRSVDAVGLSGSGFSLGVAFMLLVLTLSGRLKA